ncbi:MAG: hypothetical protein EAZ78_17920 [Oscillatoriales cyanobacterium]|nr:MAG: hypothetical protein EA000_04135 [Oscillatoriales cyanobacterium]TAD97174.1 MAG: hypothetical protein EAZ98_10365 [Oscillatoriales cyanobacterium]TAE05038.1 MAG: hypothetical protein EAZ96_06780 [Oscillatoriales cyanobacterium]TAF01572.1 MAG: hypothetical protein EAZ78_17920 [Oscillatoriales cyanobacterium]TAF35529.1 MAG: hypothetical protein EAZ68_18240 [Oscillatoriales cyanobacterium]
MGFLASSQHPVATVALFLEMVLIKGFYGANYLYFILKPLVEDRLNAKSATIQKSLSWWRIWLKESKGTI